MKEISVREIIYGLTANVTVDESIRFNAEEPTSKKRAEEMKAFLKQAGLPGDCKESNKSQRKSK